MSTTWFIFQNDNLLLTPSRTVPTGDVCPITNESGNHVFSLTSTEGNACKAFSIPSDAPVGDLVPTDLRASFNVLPRWQYLMAGKARELLFWHRNSMFCSCCGAPMAFHTDISKRCTVCGREVWPALSVAIIVAITRGDEILLVQSKNFRADYMGLVAGFVETGETLEECVRREVMEETGLTIRRLRYVKSQPWPYPSGLMVGFRAEYDGGKLTLQRSELNKGGWFRFDNLPAIPGPVSLARQLIDGWLEEKGVKSTSTQGCNK